MFRKKKYFLSNMFVCSISFRMRGIEYKCSSVESAFQAMKMDSDKDRLEISRLGPYEAKKEQRNRKMRPDWDLIKDDVMYRLLKIKFRGELGERLKTIPDEELVEINDWHDNYWGVCICEGCEKKRIKAQNKLGELLRRVKSEL